MALLQGRKRRRPSFVKRGGRDMMTTDKLMNFGKSLNAGEHRQHQRLFPCCLGRERWQALAGTFSVRGKTALTSPNTDSFRDYWFPQCKIRITTRLRHSNKMLRDAPARSEAQPPAGRRNLCKQTLSCHCSFVPPNTQLCNADAAPSWELGHRQDS